MKKSLSAISAILLSFLFALNIQISAKEKDKDDSKKHELTQESFPDKESDRYSRLTELDYARVAEQLDIEVAAIKAVSDIEAGKNHEGFISPGKPVINFQKSMFVSRLKKAGISTKKAQKRHPVAFSSLNTRKYGSYGKAQYARLESAVKIDKNIAKECTFWGMFQIGGFNWRSCDVESVNEFARLMGESEAMQLELFARFIQSNGMVKHLRNKDWRAFARAYNGASYASKGYHTRMAAAYKKYKTRK